MSIVGVVVSSDQITMIEGNKNADGTVTLIKDEHFNLEKGDRHISYAAMYNRINDRLQHRVEKVVLKASSGGKFTGTQSALMAAELRGVFIASVPVGIEVIQHHAKVLSKASSRKISDYTKDDDWWHQHFAGNVRKTNREAAYMIYVSNQ